MSEFDVYEKELSTALDCPIALRRELLERTMLMVEDFRAGKPDASWDELQDFLGGPRELAETMLEGLDQEALTRYRKRKRFWKRFALGAAVMAFAVLLGLFIFNLHDRRVPVEVSTTTIIYEGPAPWTEPADEVVFESGVEK